MTEMNRSNSPPRGIRRVFRPTPRAQSPGDRGPGPESLGLNDEALVELEEDDFLLSGDGGNALFVANGCPGEGGGAAM